MIRLATQKDLPHIERLYAACRQQLSDIGLDHQWYDFYPPSELIQQDIRDKNLYVLEVAATLVGVIVLDNKQAEGYATIDWQYLSNDVLVVHRLAMLPNFRGQGYAKRLLHFAELVAQERDLAVIRLDAYSQNKNLLKFYTQMGYQSTKEVLFLGAPWEHPFVCFEKKVK